MLILGIQSLAVMVYSHLSTRVDGISSVHAFLFMLILTLLGWVAGIYAFIEEHAWINGGITLVFGIAGALYHAAQINHIGTRSDMVNKTLAIIEFYTAPYIVLIECCKNRQTDT